MQEAGRALLAAQERAKELLSARGSDQSAKEDSTDGESSKSELAKVYYMF